jgi:predicted nucleic acid-binding Zn ribbon protein
MTEEPRKRCPKCRGKVRRLLGTGAGFIFKGPGFYATDYRKSSSGEKSGTEGGEKKGKKGDSKADGKSAGD